MTKLKKTPILTKVKKLKLLQNSKTQNMTKLKKENCEKTQNSNCDNP